MTKFCFYVSLFFGYLIALSSQSVDLHLAPIEDYSELKRHYFIEINESGRNYEIFEEDLYFSFREEYNLEGSVQLLLYGNHQDLLKTININVKYGINFYHLDLTSLGVPFELNKKYELSYGRKKLIFVPIVPPDKPTPSADIIANAIAVDCDGTGDGSLLEYYGRISSGNAPYRVNWFIFSDESKQNLIYRPLEQLIEFEGEVGAIVVDQEIGYTVVLTVLDACDNFAEKTLNVMCGDKESDGVTVYLENLYDQDGGGSQSAN